MWRFLFIFILFFPFCLFRFITGFINSIFFSYKRACFLSDSFASFRFVSRSSLRLVPFWIFTILTHTNTTHNLPFCFLLHLLVPCIVLRVSFLYLFFISADNSFCFVISRMQRLLYCPACNPQKYVFVFFFCFV